MLLHTREAPLEHKAITNYSRCSDRGDGKVPHHQEVSGNDQEWIALCLGQSFAKSNFTHLAVYFKHS